MSTATRLLDQEVTLQTCYELLWEYAGISTRYYDLADMFQEVLVPRKAEKLIIREYCEDKDMKKPNTKMRSGISISSAMNTP